MKHILLSLLMAVATTLPSAAQDKQFTDSIGVGDLAPEVSAPDTLGTVHRLSELRGQWVLLSFWASWCGDCRREIPTLKAIAEKYPELRIFGYSLDRSGEAWRKAIRRYDLGWTNVSHANGWDRSVSPYGIRWIPTTFLIDPEGRVVAVAQNERELLSQVTAVIGARESVRPAGSAAARPE